MPTHNLCVPPRLLRVSLCYKLLRGVAQRTRGEPQRFLEISYSVIQLFSYCFGGWTGINGRSNFAAKY